MASETTKSLESWLWDAACSIRGATDAPVPKNPDDSVWSAPLTAHFRALLHQLMTAQIRVAGLSLLITNNSI